MTLDQGRGVCSVQVLLLVLCLSVFMQLVHWSSFSFGTNLLSMSVLAIPFGSKSWLTCKLPLLQLVAGLQ